MPDLASHAPQPFHRRLWEAWKHVARKIGLFQTWLILSVFYWIVIAPYAIVMAPFTDPLRIKKSYGWLKRETRDLTLKDASRQF